MATSSSSDVLWDSALDEPYLLLSSPRFPPSFSLRITPVRSTDGERLIRLFNQPHIVARLHNTPNPYLPSDALDTISKWSTHIAATSPLLHANLSRPAPVLADNILNVVRLVRTSPSPSASPPSEDTSAGLLIGSLRIWTPPDKKTDASKLKVMQVSYYLLKEYTGMGIMGEVVRAVLRFWELWEGGEERKRVKIWEANAETNNTGSLRLLEKLGYKVVDVTTVPWPKATGGGTREGARLERGRFDGKI